MVRMENKRSNSCLSSCRFRPFIPSSSSLCGFGRDSSVERYSPSSKQSGRVKGLSSFYDCLPHFYFGIFLHFFFTVRCWKLKGRASVLNGALQRKGSYSVDGGLIFSSSSSSSTFTFYLDRTCGGYWGIEKATKRMKRKERGKKKSEIRMKKLRIVHAECTTSLG